MAENIAFTAGADRATVYSELLPQIEALIGPEQDMTANLGNITAALKEAFGFLWIGFYLSDGRELVLNAFQGPIACTRIAFDSGVCGHCYTTRETVIVPDVEAFPGHIACSSLSKSEIVLPIFAPDGAVWGVFDVDSENLSEFTEVDAEWLGKIVGLLEAKLRG
jgi:L-methionine (R)-S-oxide reductase